MTNLEQQDENDHLINRPELPVKPHVRWRAQTGAKSMYPKLHIDGVYTLWSIYAPGAGSVKHVILVHDPKAECLHDFDASPEERVMMILEIG